MPLGVQLLNLTWGALASVAAGIILEKLKIEGKPIQVSLYVPLHASSLFWLVAVVSLGSSKYNIRCSRKKECAWDIAHEYQYQTQIRLHNILLHVFATPACSPAHHLLVSMLSLIHCTADATG